MKDLQKDFFDWLGTQLGYKTMDDWYKVTQNDIFKHGGQSMLDCYYNNSPSQALQAVYPEHNWMPWKFGQTPHGFWEKMENQKQFFDWLGSELGYKEMDDWYSVTSLDVINAGGGELLQTKYHSVLHALQTVYPLHSWIGWKFRRVPQTFWKNQANQKQFFDWLGSELGYKKMDDWYNVTLEKIQQCGGAGLMGTHFKDSPLTALKTLYPEHTWLPWKFDHTSITFWRTANNHRYFFEWLAV